MSNAEHEVVFERRRRPVDFRVPTGVAGVLTLAATVVSVLTHSPFAAANAALFGGTVTMCLSLLAISGTAYGGRLRRLRRRVTWIPPRTDSYREVPQGAALAIDGHALPLERARKVVLGHFTNHVGGGRSVDYWPLFLVMDDHVVELDIFTDHDEARRAQVALAERLRLPSSERSTGVFGVGAGSGCLLVVMTLAADLGLLFGGGIGTLFAKTDSLRLLLPTVMVLGLWAVAAVAARAGANRVRPDVDREVREAFELTPPRVRVADPAVTEVEGDDSEADESQPAAHDEVEIEEPAERRADPLD